MYVHPIDYAELRKHAATIEAKYPIKILGVLSAADAADIKLMDA